MNILRNSLKDSNIFLFLLFIWILFIPIKNSIYQIFTILLIVYFIYFIVKTSDFNTLKELLIKFKEIISAFVFIIFSMTISNTLNEVVEEDAWKTVLMFIIRYGFIYLVLIYFYKKDFFNKRLLLLFIMISLCVQLFAGIYQSIFVYDLTNSLVYNRIHGFTFHSNNYALFMGLGLLLAFFLFISIKNYTRNLFLLLIFLFLYVVLFSYSRAVWISIFISSFIYLVYYFNRLKIREILLIISCLAIIFTILFNIEMIHQRFESILKGDSSGRINDIWLPALELIKAKFFIGYGVGIETVAKYNMAIHQFGGFHNVTIEILFYTGILGLLAYSSLLFQTIKEIYTQKNIYYFIILIFIIVDSQFDQSLFIGKPYLSSLTIFMFFVFSNRVEKTK